MARFVVCYDVSDDRRRRKIAEVLDAYGDRVQESVFELPVDGVLMDECVAELAQAIGRDDHLAIYRLCKACDGARRYLGAAADVPRIGEEEVFIV